MKKQLLTLFTAMSCFAVAQTYQRPFGIDLMDEPVESQKTEKHYSFESNVNNALNKSVLSTEVRVAGGNELAKGAEVQYANDVIIENSALDQRNVKISAAFNGWLYSAFTTSNTTSGNGGVTIRRSKNNGVTWTNITNFSFANVKFPVIDIVVAGTDTNNLTLFITGVNQNTSTGNYVLWFDKYNATTGTFLGQFGTNINYGTRKVYDVSIASDYKCPAYNATPYSVGVLYSVYAGMDSVIFVASMNGGTSMTVRQPLYSTGAYCRKVSLAYGRSSSWNNGRYFAAWERTASSSARNANIYTSRCVSTVNGTWLAPKNLDSLDANMLGRCRRPTIAVQHNNVNNDSSNVTAVVLVERDFGGTGTDYDVLGFYNRRAVTNLNWTRLDVVNASTYDMQPHMVFDPGNNNFLAVYYDSTGSKLPYRVNGMNLTNPNTWSVITPQYNDLTTNLKQAWPRVDINAAAVKAVHVWNSEGTGKGIALFDAENLSTSVKDVTESVVGADIYPNPTSNVVKLTLNFKNVTDVTLEIYDAVGNVMKREFYNGNENGAVKNINISDLADGVYILKLSSDKATSSKKLVKSSN